MEQIRKTRSGQPDKRCKTEEQKRASYRARRQRWVQHSISGRVFTWRLLAHRSGIEFTLTLKDIEPLPTHCPVLGTPLTVELMTMIRKDESKGFVPGNFLVVSRKARQLLSAASLEDLQKVCDFRSEHSTVLNS